MKKILQKLKWIPLQILIIIVLLGLSLTVAGIIFEYPSLYKLGLKLSAPIYIIVLPVCILLVVLFLVGSCLAIIDAIKKRIKEIEIGTPLSRRPSHTTTHTDRVNGGSADQAVKNLGETGHNSE